MLRSPKPTATAGSYRQLELNIISAQDLKEIQKLGKMQTYCIAWIDEENKQATQMDTLGGPNPSWNDKIIFRVDESFLRADHSAVMVEIFCKGCVRDSLVGTVRVMVSSLLNSGLKTMSFSAFQVRRPSGRPQGILNLGLMVHHFDLQFPCLSPSVGYRNLLGDFPLRNRCLNTSPLFKDGNNSEEKKKQKKLSEYDGEDDAAAADLSPEHVVHTASVGCYNLFLSSVMRSSKPKKHVHAKIHLSPSDGILYRASSSDGSSSSSLQQHPATP